MPNKSTELLAATAASTAATLPMDQLMLAFQNVLVGVASILAVRGTSWLAKRIRGR